MAHYKQAIQIGNNVTEIMKLPCVLSCTKEICGDGVGIRFLRYELTGNAQFAYRCYAYAYAGDWLCEDAEGTWHLLKNEEYEANKE